MILDCCAAGGPRTQGRQGAEAASGKVPMWFIQYTEFTTIATHNNMSANQEFATDERKVAITFKKQLQ